MNYFPLFVDFRSRRVLVIGGGEPAARRLRLLLRTGAGILVLAAEVTPEIAALAESGRLRWERRAQRLGDLDGCAAVFVATEDDALAAAASQAARAANVPVNVCDRAELSSFVVPAIIDRDPIVVAIGSEGASPTLARGLRGRIEALLPARLGDLARFARRFRAAATAVIADPVRRRRFWERVLEGPVADVLLAGDERRAGELMLGELNRRPASERGVVYLVGAGPGDPDLLTVKALRLMQQADVVLHDELIGPEILDRVRRDAERIAVGKTKGCQAASQDEINAILLREARAGRRVLRLKGGDPFVFGRGGEEVEFLRRHGVEVVTVPGITAGLGALAAAGIPLTHRDLASAASFVTGHSSRDGIEPDWQALARSRGTLVVYMGLSNAAEIAARLGAAGLDRATPVAVVQNGTRPDQDVSVGLLRELPALAARHAGRGPALLVVGDVVRLAPAWADAHEPQRAAL